MTSGKSGVIHAGRRGFFRQEWRADMSSSRDWQVSNETSSWPIIRSYLYICHKAIYPSFNLCMLGFADYSSEGLKPVRFGIFFEQESIQDAAPDRHSLAQSIGHAFPPSRRVHNDASVYIRSALSSPTNSQPSPLLTYPPASPITVSNVKLSLRILNAHWP